MMIVVWDCELLPVQSDHILRLLVLEGAANVSGRFQSRISITFLTSKGQAFTEIPLVTAAPMYQSLLVIALKNNGVTAFH